MKTAVFAHRGYSSKYPENTMLAFRKAVEAGAEGIELDIQLTQDRELAVIHDSTLDRTTDGSGLVREKTLKELNRYSAGSLVNPLYREEKVPSLEEVLRWAQKKELTLNIELKHDPEDREIIAEELLRLLQVLPQKNSTIVSSFDHEALAYIKESEEHIVTAALSLGLLIDTAAYLKKYNIEGFHYYYPMLSSKDVKKLLHHGVKMRPFTVNDAESLKECYQSGCTAVITDDPHRALILRNR
ncbi:glycerophosphodiester phosphodiesterase family protein [Alkalicoccus halolimnae]|uniref:Glycerophosphodiester phosphodiesterase family protein n=1 Tax=Alkalicoccus halolimnae TaxID=1667239 RepID=A0A5C7F3N2_9BACI|nr:glycerophosphodiester phosphodiesterase family protein [Alkalicoccus halolimnae]TXF82787.1 glycerophosphodiester phosphodiesterase [Alkalicoccus halolimnae]